VSQRVFITGGASGLGRALAEIHAKEGARVLIGDIDAKRMEETLDALGRDRAHAIRCDVTKEEDVVAAAAWCEERWGGVDIVYNNAGVAAGGAIDAFALADWAWVVDINLMGVVRGCKAFVPMLKRQRSGHIVNTASMAGLIHPPQMAPYNVTKAGVVSLSETLRTELAPHGVKVSVVCPSFFRTNLIERFRGAGPDVERTTRRLLTRAKLSAPEVAAIVRRGVARGDFLILTDKEGRQAWRAKQLLPSDIFARIVAMRAARTMETRPGAEE
jgi:NAD(P)-dependent dehydrogenase (short-subunit alcohol dehydrogenase family)